MSMSLDKKENVAVNVLSILFQTNQFNEPIFNLPTHIAPFCRPDSWRTSVQSALIPRAAEWKNNLFSSRFPLLSSSCAPLLCRFTCSHFFKRLFNASAWNALHFTHISLARDLLIALLIGEKGHHCVGPWESPQQSRRVFSNFGLWHLDQLDQQLPPG